MITDYEENFQAELNKLNTSQKEAVDTIEGPVLVLAGPGTGKTQILSARIGNILKNTDSGPNNILCLTYTDAGAIAMRKRLLDFIGPESYNVHIYTFHAFCNQVIQENLDYFGLRNLQPVTDLERIEIIQEVIDELKPDDPLKRLKGDIYYDAKPLLSLFDEMKREHWTPSFISEEIDKHIESLPFNDKFIYQRNGKDYKKGDLKQKQIDEVARKMNRLRAAVNQFDNYQQKLLSKSRYDYQDMILWVLEAFEKSDYMLLQYQERYHYFLVDEYQDTNGAQNEILNYLSNYWEQPNVFVVGDDDQSIYRFQGASVTNIKDFDDTYKDTIKRIVLTDNYRSSQDILNISKSLIDNNQERLINYIPGLSKDLQAQGINAKHPVVPQIIEYQNQIQEEVALLNEIEKIYDSGKALNEVAVIYRNHSQVENLIKVLEKRKIPINVKRKVDILTLPLVTQLIDILRFVQLEYEQPDSAEYLLYRLMHFGFFGIDHRDIATISRTIYDFRKNGKDYKWNEFLSKEDLVSKLELSSQKNIETLHNNLNHWVGQIENITIQVLFEKILTQGKVIQYIMNSDDRPWHMQVLTTFFNFIKDETAKNPKLKLKGLLNILDRMERNNISMDLNKILHSTEGVNFVTAHSSKGLEFDKVYLIGCNAKTWESKSNRSNFTFPDSMKSSDKDQQVEDERRLFYVGMTRARQELKIFYSSETNDGKPREKSRFIVDILAQYPELLSFGKVPDDAMLAYNLEILSGDRQPTIKLIDKDLLDQALQKFRLSVTAMNKYLDCPIRYYFENVIRVPSARSDSMGFGNAIHYALETLFRQMQNHPDKEFPSSEAFMGIFMEGMEIFRSHFTDEEFERRSLLAKEILPVYYDEYVDRWNKNVRVEYSIDNTQVNGIPIAGALDKLEFDGDSVNVVDYKTGTPENMRKYHALKKPGENEEHGGEYWRQIVFYKILLDNDPSNSWRMISGEMDFIQRDKQEKFVKEKIVVSSDDVDYVTKLIKEVYQKIMDHEFETGCGKEDCQWCNFVESNFNSEELDLQEEVLEE